MNRADKLLLKNGYDLKGNYTGERIEILNKRQRVKRNSKPYIKLRKRAEKSKAEVIIAKYLADNGVRFISEYWFRTCYNTKTSQLLYFDFYLPDYNAVIEFDGLHHFSPIYGKLKFEQTKINDWIKNKYCERRKIPLLRIACFDSHNIEKLICEWFDKYWG